MRETTIEVKVQRPALKVEGLEGNIYFSPKRVIGEKMEDLKKHEDDILRLPTYSELTDLLYAVTKNIETEQGREIFRDFVELPEFLKPYLVGSDEYTTENSNLIRVSDNKTMGLIRGGEETDYDEVKKDSLIKNVLGCKRTKRFTETMNNVKEIMDHYFKRVTSLEGKPYFFIDGIDNLALPELEKGGILLYPYFKANGASIFGNSVKSGLVDTNHRSIKEVCSYLVYRNPKEENSIAEF